MRKKIERVLYVIKGAFMNLYGIYAWFGYLLPLKERFRLIRDAGFDCVMLWWGDDFYELDGKKTAHPELARSYGLTVENAHAPYQFSNDLWDSGINGTAYEKLIMGCIEDCAACGIPTLVMHIIDDPFLKIGDAGICRLQRLVEQAERDNVTLALENVQKPQYLDCIFSRIKSEHLGFCYDSGHEFAISGGFSLLEKYGCLLKAMHLHDNNGKEDQHLLPGEGKINWTDVAAKIKAAGYKGAICLESCAPWDEQTGKSSSEPPEAYLKRAIQAVEKICELL